MKISVIIPTYNEEGRIGALLDYLLAHRDHSLQEIIVVDGGSSDNTSNIVGDFNITLLKSPQAGRANQLNYGAEKSSGDILYFIHADTFPPATYLSRIREAVSSGISAGCFAYLFDSGNPALKLNNFFNQFKGFYTGGGDQTLFVTRDLFDLMGGFDTRYVIMEDFEFVRRLRAAVNFQVLKDRAIVSARKYDMNSYLRVNLVNLAALIMFKMNVMPLRISRFYNKHIKRADAVREYK